LLGLCRLALELQPFCRLVLLRPQRGNRCTMTAQTRTMEPTLAPWRANACVLPPSLSLSLSLSLIARISLLQHLLCTIYSHIPSEKRTQWADQVPNLQDDCMCVLRPRALCETAAGGRAFFGCTRAIGRAHSSPSHSTLPVHAVTVIMSDTKKRPRNANGDVLPPPLEESAPAAKKMKSFEEEDGLVKVVPPVAPVRHAPFFPLYCCFS